MRHSKKFNHLGRKTAHRKAMLANMAASLIVYKRIKTTVAKAKALRVYVEPLITKSKDDTTHSRRVIFSYLKDKEAVTELFREVANKVANRPGGYTRILKTGNRLGDNAEMCFIELVDYNETYSDSKTEAKPKTRRSRRGGSAKVTEETVDTGAEVVETKELGSGEDTVDPVVEEQIEHVEKTDALKQEENTDDIATEPPAKKTEEKISEKTEEVAGSEEKEIILKPETPPKEDKKVKIEKKEAKKITPEVKADDPKAKAEVVKGEKKDKAEKQDKPKKTVAKENKKPVAEDSKKEKKEETKKDAKKDTE